MFVLFSVYIFYSSTTWFKLLRVYNMFCIWKSSDFPLNSASHIQLFVFSKNFLVILIFFQMFPRFFQSLVMLSKCCWNIYCTCIKCSIWFWETWHFNRIEFYHPGTCSISLVTVFWNYLSQVSYSHGSHILFILSLAQIQVLWALQFMQFRRLFFF